VPAGVTTVSAATDIEAIVARLAYRLDLADSVVRAHVHEAAAMFADARIRSFVPLLIEREARHRLSRSSREA